MEKVNCDKTRLSLEIIDEMKTGMCLISAYPYKGHWCNKSWLGVWECKTRDEWYESTAHVMENWSQATHVMMKNLRQRVQVDKEVLYQTYTIYRNSKRKIVNVCQRPFEYNGETVVLYEHMPQQTEIEDAMKRSMEGFRHALSIITLFDTSGNILQQNPASMHYHHKEKIELACKQTEQTAFEYIIGNDELHGQILEQVVELGSYCCSIVQRNERRKANLRRRLNATYGLDPVLGKKMVVLDESYAVEPFCTEPEEYRIMQLEVPSAEQVHRFVQEMKRKSSLITIRTSSSDDMTENACLASTLNDKTEKKGTVPPNSNLSLKLNLCHHQSTDSIPTSPASVAKVLDEDDIDHLFDEQDTQEDDELTKVNNTNARKGNFKVTKIGHRTASAPQCVVKTKKPETPHSAPAIIERAASLKDNPKPTVTPKVEKENISKHQNVPKPEPVDVSTQHLLNSSDPMSPILEHRSDVGDYTLDTSVETSQTDAEILEQLLAEQETSTPATNFSKTVLSPSTTVNSSIALSTNKYTKEQLQLKLLECESTIQKLTQRCAQLSTIGIDDF